MTACEQELCRNWTGRGCACEVFGIDPDTVQDEDGDRWCCETCRRIAMGGIDGTPWAREDGS